MEISLASLGALLAHLLYALIGVAVLALGPRVRANRAFAVFSVGSGLAGVVGRLVEPLRMTPGVAEPLEAGLWALGAVGVVALARVFPEPLGPRDRGIARGAIALGGVLGALLVASWLHEFPGGVHLAVATFSVLMATSGASAVLMAARALRSPGHLLPCAAMALAVFAPPAIATGSGIGAGAAGRFVFMPIFSVLCLGAVAAAWLFVVVRMPDRRWPIAVAWMALGAALAGQVSAMGGGWSLVAWESTIVVVRLFAVAPLAFLIVRGQVPGLETKVRWTVSRGTIAAAFVTAFFVASEGAQILLGGGNEWVGLVGAGALVFAIAPLQRAAERLAEKAVPGEAGPGGEDLRREALYRQALRFALTDRDVSQAEDLHLFRLAEEMGIQAGRAMEMRQEIEAERQEAGR